MPSRRPPVPRHQCHPESFPPEPAGHRQAEGGVGAEDRDRPHRHAFLKLRNGSTELVDAALGPLAQRAVELAEQAARAEDPWQGFASFVEDTCALFADDRGYADVYRSSMPGTPAIAASRQRLSELKAAIMARAKRAGVLRADIEPSDIAILTWGIVGTMDATRDVAPDAWRRHLALLLDGLRPQAAHPLPAPPLSPDQLRDASPR
jgi:hypothetical protein